MTTRMLILAAALALGGCATTGEFGAVGRQAVKNQDGHVVGYKETLRNKGTGEVSARVTLFTPILAEDGDVIGYEEQTRDGAIIRDLRGQAVGSRFIDVRSRQTNQRNRGVTIVIGSLDTRRVVAEPVRPALAQLAAALSVTDLRTLR